MDRDCEEKIGLEMHQLCQTLFPICRSITGNGFRKSLDILKREVPGLISLEVPTGTKCFDWIVPREWNIDDAYILDPDGKKIIDFKMNNLHVVGYSVPVDCTISLSDLQKHLHSLPDQPDAIPYVTSYYEERWGFCLTENQRKTLKEGTYRVVINSELIEGSLTYGELLIPGETKKEIFISSYLCHPSMANNELSGPVVAVYIAKWLMSLLRRKYSYRIIIIPETIGSIVYLNKNLDVMKKRIIAGFNLTCIGDERSYSFLPSRSGDTMADQVARHTLQHIDPNYIAYSYLDRGSDERQYCSPGVDLPVCSMMRSKYGEYDEYHTSLDDLHFVTAKGLLGGYKAIKRVIECLESNRVFKCTYFCEPQLGKRGLYPTLSTKFTDDSLKNMMNYLAYADGLKNNLEIANIIGVPLWELNFIIDILEKNGLIVEYIN